jgi:predicted nucleotidyltransferase
LKLRNCWLKILSREKEKPNLLRAAAHTFETGLMVLWPEAVSDRIRRKVCQYFVAIMRSVTLKAGRQNEQFPPTVQELRKRLLSFCQKHPITKLEVFGSVADGTAKPGSDVDLMVTFRPGVKVGTEFLDMISELEDLLGGPTRERERRNDGKLDQAEIDP